jgi:hypothetical protein
MSTVSCPQCCLPATLTDQFVLATDRGEPIEHVRISCPSAHHFLMARDRLSETTPVVESALAAMLAAVATTSSAPGR